MMLQCIQDLSQLTQVNCPAFQPIISLSSVSFSLSLLLFAMLTYMFGLRLQCLLVFLHGSQFAVMYKHSDIAVPVVESDTIYSPQHIAIFIQRPTGIWMQ